MMGCLAALCLTFTACNDDDDDERQLTEAEVQQAYEAVRGSHSGSLIYSVRDRKTQKVTTDTLAASWNVLSDSVMTIHNFPTQALAANITDTLVAKALAASASKDMKCYIGFIRISPVTFLINPVVQNYDINYDGGAHKLTLAFYGNNYYSFGRYSNSTMAMQVVLGGVYLDNSRTNLINTGIPFVLTGK